MAIQKKALLWTTAAALGLMSAGAFAGNQCPPNPIASENFKVFIATDPSGECWDYGVTNVSANNNVQYTNTSVAPYNSLEGRTDDANGDGLPADKDSEAAKYLQLPGNGVASLQGAIEGDSGTGGYLTITRDAASTSTNVFGTWSVTPGVIVGDLFLLLKTGEKLDPVWAVFKFAYGTTSGKWAITCDTVNGTVKGEGCGLGLSHASLYGQVPLPAAAWLLLSGLVGLFGISRRRGAVAA